MLRNRRASHDYELLDRFEAGIQLTGSEVKSLRTGGGSIAEAFARMEGDEVILEGLTIPVYTEASYNNHLPTRPRKLLLHRSEIDEIRRALERKGLTLVPLKLDFKGGWVKVDLALARGKKLHDKRKAEAKKDAQREMDRAMSRRGKE